MLHVFLCKHAISYDQIRQISISFFLHIFIFILLKAFNSYTPLETLCNELLSIIVIQLCHRKPELTVL